ncbi:MAG TPA: hypothetical protein O0X27_06625, partial [Methanocorpusculum sp.]|nr:hypothetical protein [Methanocorpusculum sp.]
MERNKIPFENREDFCYTEEKIADILMTYTKNRKQEPHPLYYKALAAAVKKMFVRFEESLA